MKNEKKRVNLRERNMDISVWMTGTENRNDDIFGKVAAKRAEDLRSAASHIAGSPPSSPSGASAAAAGSPSAVGSDGMIKPISFLGLTFHGKSPEKLPPHIHLVEKSVSGKLKGDLNSRGIKSPYLFYRRTDGDEKPITSVILISPDQGEEPPLGYELIRTTAGGKEANICARSKSPSLFLCFQRGEGPPINDIAVIHVKKEQVPPGWVLISRLMNGRTPELDAGQTLIAFRQDFASVILRFQKYERIATEQGILGGKYLAKCLGCLIGGIYSYDRNAFLIALEAFTSLDSVTSTFPPGMLAEFIILLRDAVSQYITVFPRDTYNKVLTWLEHIFKTRSKELDTIAFQSIIHLCIFLRHEDARMNMTKILLTRVITNLKVNYRHTRKAPKAPSRRRFHGMASSSSKSGGTVKAVMSTTDVIGGGKPKLDLDGDSGLSMVDGPSTMDRGVTAPSMAERSGVGAISEMFGAGGSSDSDDGTAPGVGRAPTRGTLSGDDSPRGTAASGGGSSTPEPTAAPSTSVIISGSGGSIIGGVGSGALMKFGRGHAPVKCSKDMTDSFQRLIVNIAAHVATVKSTERELLTFSTAIILDRKFHEHTSQLIDSVFDNRDERFMIAGAFLLAKISSARLPPKLTYKSESIKRRIHALKLLAFYLEEAASFFKSSVPALAILRRVVFTSFIYSALSPVPAVFKTMFRVYEIFWGSYRHHLKYEIGVLLDTGMIGFLSSANCTPSQKVDLLDGLTAMFKNKSALINIFYNFDNDLFSWPVCANLVTCVAKLTGGEYATTNHYGHKEDGVVQGALRLLARFMQLMAKYLGAPNLNAGGNLDDQEDFDTLGDDYWESGGFDYGDSAAAEGALGSLATYGAHRGPIDRMESTTKGSTQDWTEASMQELTTLEPSKTVGSASGLASSPARSAETSQASVSGEFTAKTGAPTTEDFLGVESGVKSDGDEEKKEEALPPASAASGSKHPVIKSLWETEDGDEDKDDMDYSRFAPTVSLGTDEMTGKGEASGSGMIGVSPVSPGGAAGHVVVGADGGIGWDRLEPRMARSGTYAARYDKHKAQQKLVDEALKKSRPPSGSVKAAVKHLLASGDARVSSLKFIAQFLFQNETLDKSDVGEFISSLNSSVFSQEQHADLRLIYMQQLHFTSMTFDAAFRHFLTDCGFRLPLEAQKIDRLVEGFAMSYHRDNPHVFADSDQPFMLAYAVLMLNTELHNPKASAAASGGPMTKEAFKSLVRQKENPFPPELVSQLYDSIKENPIENITASSLTTYTATLASMGAGTDGSITDEAKHAEALERIMKAFRGECTKFVQRALGNLRTHSTKYSKNAWLKCNDTRVVRVLFEVTWHQFLAAITTVLRSTDDVATITECLEAIKYSCCTAIMLGLTRPELRAFAEDLSKFVYLSNNKHLKGSITHLHTVKGEHLKQKWFLKLMNLCEKQIKPLACYIVSRICNDMQQRVIYDNDMSILREIEAELNDTVYLTHPHRRFVKQGKLKKQAKKGDIMIYTFYLFNDLLIYVSQGRGEKMVVHRTLRLSLCRIVDLRDGFVRHTKNVFRVISPQKPVVLIADNAQEKHEWMTAINACIQEQLEMRELWLKNNQQTLRDLHVTQQYSKFLGREVKPKRHELRRVQLAETFGSKSKDLSDEVKLEMLQFQRTSPCKLCLKPFKKFTRKSRCPWCTDTICNSCIHRKVKPPTQEEMMHGSGFASAKKGSAAKSLKVCDACFGTINYYYSEINQTTVEFSVTEASSIAPSHSGGGPPGPPGSAGGSGAHSGGVGSPRGGSSSMRSVSSSGRTAKSRGKGIGKIRF